MKLVLKAGREGLWRTTKGRELQVCAAEKQKAREKDEINVPMALSVFRDGKKKARPPCCFLLKVGIRKVMSWEEERRDLEGT